MKLNPKIARKIAYVLRSIGFGRMGWNLLCRNGIVYGGPLAPDLVLLLSDLAGGGTVVEHGCGIGTLPIQLRPGSFKNYIGYDIGDAAIQTANARSLPNCRFIRSSMEEWTGELAPINLIVCKEVVYYLTADDLIRFIEQARNALAPFGKLVITLHDRIKHAKTLDMCLQSGAVEVLPGPPVVLTVSRSVESHP